MRVPTLTAAFALLLAPATGSAAVMVLGAGDARQCYLAAETKSSPRESLTICTRALDEGPSGRDHTATLVNRGIVRMWALDNRGAVADFDAALAEAPNLPEALVDKGVALVRDNSDLQGAVTLLTRALDAHVQRPEIAYYARGLANETLGDIKAAYHDYRSAAALKPSWSEPARQLARFSVVERSKA